MASRIEAGRYGDQKASDRIVAIAEAARPRIHFALVRGRLLNWTLASLLPHGWLDIGNGHAPGLPTPVRSH